MTKEEKQLLIKDLCTRLPYGVLVKCSDTEGTLIYDGYRLHEISEDGSYLALSAVDIPHGVSNLDLEFCDIKPYLRPMSCMTEEEFKGLRSICPHSVFNNTIPGWIVGIYGSDYGRISHIDEISKLIDWLNAHHFDYRGLIEEGLALEAPDGMYKTK